MCGLCKMIKKAIRYWMFPESRMLDIQTQELGRYEQERERLLSETREIVSRANQSDVLRNLVISMQRDSK